MLMMQHSQTVSQFPRATCLDDYEIQNARHRLDERGESAYRKVLATCSQVADLAHLNTTHGVSGKPFSWFLHDQATRQREEDTDPLLIPKKSEKLQHN
jgi:hypothetical protein